MAKSFEIWLMEHIQGINVYDFTRIKLKKYLLETHQNPEIWEYVIFQTKLVSCYLKLPQQFTDANGCHYGKPVKFREGKYPSSF